MSNEIVLPLHGPLQESVGDLCRLVEALAPAFASETTNWHLRLSDCRELSSGPAAIILAAMFGSGRGFRVTFEQPEMPELIEFLATSVASFTRQSSRPEFCNPLRYSTQVRDVDFNDPGGVLSLLRGQIDVSAEVEDGVGICIREALYNVQDHASSKIGAILSAEYRPQHRCLDVAVVDCGVGIVGSLQRRFPDVDDAQVALDMVMEGRSAKSRSSNLGQGFSNMLAIVNSYQAGQLVMVSGDGIAGTSGYGWKTKKKMATPFPGTGVFVSLFFQ